MLNLVGVIINTLVLWTVSPVMITGAAVLSINLISVELGKIVNLISGVPLTYFVNIVNFSNNFLLSIFQTP